MAKRVVFFRVALILAACAFALLTLLVETTPSFRLDLEVTRGLQSLQAPFLAWAMAAISWVGSPPQSLIIVALVVGALYGLGLRWEAVMALSAAVSSMAIALLVKELVQRPRPTLDLVHVFDILSSYSFPSGHVMFYVGFFGLFGFLAFRLLRPSAQRSLLLALAGGLIGLVGVSRIYLGAHWASDVLGSYLLGSLTLVALIQIYVWGKGRVFVHGAGAGERLGRR